MARDWNKFFENPDETPSEPVKRAGGRPKGSPNRPKEQIMMENKTKDLFKRVEHMLDDDQKAYFQDVMRGKAKFDPIREAELLIRYSGLYVVAALQNELNKENVVASQDLAKVIDAHRMALKDVEDMSRKREDARIKAGDDERMVDATRESSLARFEGLHGDDSPTG